MTKGKIMEGVFAINKPKMLSSAQVVRDLQNKFQPSELFEPWIASQQKQRLRENHNQRQRRREKTIKVKIGHGGTLDPLATGVLIIGVGKGTKSLSDFLLCTKTYEAVILFGTSTDSYDRVGKVLKRAPYDHITKQMVEDALDQFRGRSKQLPPLFSALKMNGKPLYEYAREGKELPREIERRDVEVLDLQLLEWMEGDTHEHKAPLENSTPEAINIANKLWAQEGVQPAGKDATQSPQETENKKRKLSDTDDLVSDRPTSKIRAEDSEETTMSGGLPVLVEGVTESAVEESDSKVPHVKGPPAARIRMTVTSGFYVRSLCHDLGAAVGSAALMAELERTRQGDYEVGKNTLEYSDLAAGEQVWGPKVSGYIDAWESKTVAAAPAVKQAETVEKQEDAAGNKEETVAKTEETPAKEEETATKVEETPAKTEEAATKQEVAV